MWPSLTRLYPSHARWCLWQLPCRECTPSSHTVCVLLFEPLPGITQPVLVMSYIPARFIGLAASNNITATVYDKGLVQKYADTLQAGARLTCHIKVTSFACCWTAACFTLMYVQPIAFSVSRLIAVWADWVCR